ncbi:MAG: sterol desaturase family protein [Candidatus Obscuribacterales bacterium]|nr:sterol desaturase family protein [Candidatus Obscuribacterales bacterium]
MNTILHIAASMLVAYVLVSLIEYLVHRYPMHSPRLAKHFKNKYLEGAYKNHASLHHNHYYSVFDHEEDEFGREVGIPVGVRNSVFVVGPFILLSWSIDPITGAAVLFFTALHNVAWTTIHRAMHDRSAQHWWTRTALFGFYTRYHFLHHRQQGKNYNAFYPMWDWLLGTLAQERESDRLEMEKSQWRVRSPREQSRF